MTPKEKAEELFNKFAKYTSFGRFDDEWENVINAKTCAIIAVDEIIKIKLLWYQKDTKELDYWNDVKNEINMIPKVENQ